jgi:hypothetical protein
MPSPRAFANAFGIKVNKVEIDSCSLSDFKIGHDVIKRFRTYQFPMTFTFTSKNDITSDKSDMLVVALQVWFKDCKIVLSQYGNPYKCTITDIKASDPEGNKVTLTAMGHGERIFSKGTE